MKHLNKRTWVLVGTVGLSSVLIVFTLRLHTPGAAGIAAVGALVTSISLYMCMKER